MNHRQFLQAYEQQLATQDWAQLAEFVHDEAIFIFSEGTFRGKEEIGAAFTKTFNLIKEEKYWLENVEWLIETEEVASCIYNFNWQGIINGQAMSGGGRGTSILRRVNGRWRIIHEHLGPHPR